MWRNRNARKGETYRVVASALLLWLGAIIALLGAFITPYAAIPFLLIIFGYCGWWLYDRLICLGGDRYTIGLLGHVEPPSDKYGFDKRDADYSINLILAPHQPLELPADYFTRPHPAPPPLADPKAWADQKYKERRCTDKSLMTLYEAF